LTLTVALTTGQHYRAACDVYGFSSTRITALKTTVKRPI